MMARYPDFARRLAHRHAPALVAQRARRYQRELRRSQGVTAAAEGLVRSGPAMVAEGPFVGLRYPAERLADVDAPVAKLLGIYERELYPTFQAELDRGVRTFIDVGCADGYYAVGMPHAAPGLVSHAYDLARSARELCAEVARVNGVQDRVRIGRRFSADTLGEVDVRGGLLLCDIEGAERALFDRRLAERLAQTTVIVEVHEDEDPGLSDALSRVFSSSGHALERIAQQPREPVEGLPPVALTEYRPPRLHWLVCRPAAR